MPPTSPAHPRTRRGFTLVELGATLTLATTAGAMLAASTLAPPTPPAAATPPAAKPAQDRQSELLRARSAARQLKDATQVRSIIQSFVIFANHNQDRFPLPSALDLGGFTLAGDAAAKDTTANILSILIFQGAISTEMCVSPAESNPKIKADDDYEFALPKTARDPDNALWDPAFSADFTGDKTGNVSYAHLQTSGARLPKWSNSFASDDVIAGNRGPEIASVSVNDRGFATATPARKESNTYLIHGPKESWEGNLGFADGHVNFETSYGPGIDPTRHDWPTYLHKNGKRAADVIFFDEPDDATPGPDGKPSTPPAYANSYLGIFIKSGPAPSDYKAIWD